MPGPGTHADAFRGVSRHQATRIRGRGREGSRAVRGLAVRVREQGVEEARGAVERDAAAAQTLERGDRGAVREIVDEGVTGAVFANLDDMVAGLPRVFDLDRRRIHERAVARFSGSRMAAEYEAVYLQLVERHSNRKP